MDSTLRKLAMVGVATLIASCADEPPPPIPDGPAVGMQRFEWVDDSRQSWDGTGPRAHHHNGLVPDRCNRTNVRVDTFRSAGVLHGVCGPQRAVGQRRGEISGRTALARHRRFRAPADVARSGLAANGFIALAVDHHGNTAAEAEYDARGFRLVWERIPDLSRALDQLAADPKFAARLDLSDVSAIGFSLGGYTVTGLAGALTDLNRLQAFCRGPDADGTCEPQTEYPDAAADFAAMLEKDPSLASRFDSAGVSYKDDRVGRFMAIAPAIGQAFSPPTLAEVDLPALIVVGSDDQVAPAATNASHLADHLPDAQLQVIERAGHFIFLSQCTSHGRRYVPVCQDAEGVDRASVHESVTQAAIEFLRAGRSRSD